MTTSLTFRWPLRGVALVVAESLLLVLANHLASGLTVIVALAPLVEVPDVATDVRATRNVHRPHLDIAVIVVHVLVVLHSGCLGAPDGPLSFSGTATRRAVAPSAGLPLVLQVDDRRSRSTAVLRMVAREQGIRMLGHHIVQIFLPCL